MIFVLSDQARFPTTVPLMPVPFGCYRNGDKRTQPARRLATGSALRRARLRCRQTACDPLTAQQHRRSVGRTDRTKAATEVRGACVAGIQ